MATLKKGVHVNWQSSQGTVHGIVEKKQVSPTHVKTHKVAASPANPEFIVKSSRTGAKAAHKAQALHKE